MFRHIAHITFLLLSICGYSQNYFTTGRYPGQHFSVVDYGSNPQIWCGAADKSYTYFGNRNDLLQFNGYDWEKIKTDPKTTSTDIQEKVNESTVRWLLNSSDNKTYVARDGNFGYIGNSALGQTVYVPILVASDKDDFGKIWSIYETPSKEILFVGRKTIFRYKNGKVIKRTSLPEKFRDYGANTSCRIGNGLLFVVAKEDENETERALYYDFGTDLITEIPLPEHISLTNLRGSFEVNGTWYVLDRKTKFHSIKINAGKFTWEAPKSTLFPGLKDFKPSYIARHKDHLFYATEDKGLIKADLNGKIVRQFDDFDELATLYVNSFFHDYDGNLWLCLDNGIQIIETSSPIVTYKKREGISSVSEAIDFNSGEPLLALHTDIFSPEASLTHAYFVSKKVVQDNVYDLETFNTDFGKRTLFVGSDSLYEYFPKTKTKKGIAGVYAYCYRQDPVNKNVVYVTLENGLGKLELKANNRWSYNNLVTDTKGRTFSMAVRNNKVYFGISDNGVGIYNLKTRKFKLLRNSASAFGKDAKQLNKSDFFVELFQGKVFVGTAYGLKTISEDDTKLIDFLPQKHFFKNNNNTLHRLVNIDNKELWIVNYEEINPGKFTFVTSWLTNQNGEWKMTKWLQGGLQKAGVIASIQRDAFGNMWLGANSGVFIIDKEKLRDSRVPFGVTIDRLEINEKTVIYNPTYAKRHLQDLKYSNNSFKVFFHANTFSGMGNMLYRYKLEGFDNQWSQWSAINYANFQKIPEGTYTVRIQAKNSYGVISDSVSYEVTILPPWYRTIWAYILYGVAFIALLILSVRISTARVKRQNQKLEEIVKERTSEIAEQNHQLENQKAEIVAKSNDILDSIQYAKRIQTTILPSETRLKELFEEHFVFYRPKDIVSGDFYWAREVQGKVIFSAIDCTGHGVPGSLVSIVGNNGLLRAVNEFKLTEPNQILDKLREIVVDAFRTESELDVKDGMDIALCAIDYATEELRYAGANNECVIIRNDEIIELRPDKQPIGSYVDVKPFSVKSFNLQDGDCIYLFTDGYVDQFGGEKGKKFKSRQFKDMLLSLHKLNMKEQFEAVQNAFDTWKADLDQVDDVCVFAVRYKSRL